MNGVMTTNPPAFARSALRIAGALVVAAALYLPARAEAPALPGLVSHGLVGVASLPGNVRDKFGETTIAASGLAVDRASWRREGDTLSGMIWMLPDRGWNVEGTIDYRPRIHKLAVTIAPGKATMTLVDTIKLTDAAGAELTGLDPVRVRAAANGFPEMPEAENGRVSLDPEAIAYNPDGTFFITDEYGPYIYRFSSQGRMLGAIRPPDAFIPRRKGATNFSSNNPGPGASKPEPPNPEFGRQNNQGFEGMSLTPDGRMLVVILQSATRQDGGDTPETREHTRILFYDVSDLAAPKLVRENVVALPDFRDEQGRRRIAAQSELLALDSNRFLLLSRDSNNGYGTRGATSLYRKIDLLDTSGATDIVGSAYDGTTPVAPGGKLVEGVTPAKLTPFIDINDNAQLNKFGLHNGAPNDKANLSEKWEAMGLVPALDPANPRDFYLLVGNDNDFMTQDGFQAGSAYKEDSGVDLDTRLLVYRIAIPDLR
jgi:hypothetical protein